MAYSVPLLLLGLAAKTDRSRLVDEATDGAGCNEDDEKDFGCFRHCAPPGLKPLIYIASLSGLKPGPISEASAKAKYRDSGCARMTNKND
jgi:hypothetical protein